MRSHDFDEFLCDKMFDWAFCDNEDDLNEALLQASDEFESKSHLVQQLHFGLHLQQAPPAADQTRFFLFYN